MNSSTDLIGKTLLVMLTLRDDTERTTGYKQFHGNIIRADSAKGITVYVKRDLKEVTLPFHNDALHVARPGEYRNHSTGEVVVNPDFYALWEVTLHDKEHGGGMTWKVIEDKWFSNDSLVQSSNEKDSGLLKFLVGVTLVWRHYRQYPKNPNWDHDHCEFCGAKFCMKGHPGALLEGYATLDDYYWICSTCFEKHQPEYNWTVRKISDSGQ